MLCENQDIKAHGQGALHARARRAVPVRMIRVCVPLHAHGAAGQCAATPIKIITE